MKFIFVYSDVNLGNLGRQVIDIKPFPMNSDEEDNTALSTSSGGRDDTGSRTDRQQQRGQRQNNKRTYGGNVDFEEDSIDDINMAAIAPIDDIPMENRNPRFFRFLVFCLSYMIIVNLMLMLQNINYFTEPKSEQIGVLGSEISSYILFVFIKKIRLRYL